MKYNNLIVKAENITKLATTPFSHPLNTERKRHAGSITEPMGLNKLGINVYIIPAGGISTEFHAHQFCDEFIYILSGNGEVYLNDETYPISQGDFIGFPAEGPAHMLKNTSNCDLIYFVGGDKTQFDICNYPHKNMRGYIYYKDGVKQRQFIKLEDINDK